MLQLVGYWMREESLASPIALEDAQRGIRLATNELRDGVLAATYRELSNGDLRFLEAMLPDEGPSTLADIAKRMGGAEQLRLEVQEAPHRSWRGRRCGPKPLHR